MRHGGSGGGAGDRLGCEVEVALEVPTEHVRLAEVVDITVHLVGDAVEAADALHLVDELGGDGGLHARQLVGRDALIQRVGEDGVGRRLELGEVVTRAWRQHHAEGARDLGRRVVGHRVLGDLLLVHQRPVEARGLAAAEDAREHVERGVVGAEDRGGGNRHIEARKLDPVLDLEHHVAMELRHPASQLAHRGSRWNRAEVTLHQLLHGGGLEEAACHHEAGVVGRVVAAEELLDVVEGGCGEVGHGADGGPAVGVVGWVEDLLHLFVDGSVGCVLVALPALVLDHGALVVEPLLGGGLEEETHAVGLEPESALGVGGRDQLPVAGAVGVGAAVDRAADVLQGLEVVVVEVL